VQRPNGPWVLLVTRLGKNKRLALVGMSISTNLAGDEKASMEENLHKHSVTLPPDALIALLALSKMGDLDRVAERWGPLAARAACSWVWQNSGGWESTGPSALELVQQVSRTFRL
jgi:hypothetical protein